METDPSALLAVGGLDTGGKVLLSADLLMNVIWNGKNKEIVIDNVLHTTYRFENFAISSKVSKP